MDPKVLQALFKDKHIVIIGARKTRIFDNEAFTAEMGFPDELRIIHGVAVLNSAWLHSKFC